MSTAIILLAAGQGSRMHSDLPKVLHPLGGAPILHHAMQTGAEAGATRTVVVTGHGGEAVAAAARDFDPEAEFAQQAEQLGTAHAVAQAADNLADHTGTAIVLYGDTPFVRPETLTRMQDAAADVVILGFEAADPTGYGRLVLTADGSLDAIVEHKDATEAQRV